MKKQVIFSAIILFAVIAMASCGNRHAPRAVNLSDMNDSINYALGHDAGAGIGRFYLQDIANKDAAIRAFIEAVDKAFNSDADPDEMYQVGVQIGNALRQMENTGLMGEADLESNTRLIRQGLEAGLRGTSQNWSSEDAQEFIQQTLMQIQEERARAMFNFDFDELFIDEEIIELD